MGIRTLAGYLIGRRGPILEFAASRWTAVLGFLFVLSAAFAREYDGADLLHEPHHLLAPLGASLLSSFVLFNISYPLSKPKTRNYFGAYWAFLGLFWMTAPLAWLYAVPYERFLTPEDAMRANLYTLGLVSAWRVALMVRVVVVHMNYPPWTAFFLVMLFADGLALLALAYLPVPILSLMGGIQLSGPDKILFEIACGVGQLGCFSLPIWIIGTMLTLAMRQEFFHKLSAVSSTNHTPKSPLLSLWILAAASLAIWVVLLPVTQPEQQLRYSVEKDFKEGNISQALAIMSAHSPGDFPPTWDPPPRPMNQWSGENPVLFDIFAEMAKNPPAPWVREMYLQKLQDWLWFGYFSSGNQLEMIRLLKKLPERTALLTAKDNPPRDRDFFVLLKKEFGIEIKDQTDD
jgi:hypothetical protein